MEFWLPTVPIFCLVAVWLARPPWKTGLAISLLTLAAVACAVGLIQSHRQRLEADSIRFYREVFARAGLDASQANSLAGAFANQSYRTNIELQHLMALGLGFPVVLAGLVLGARRDAGERRTAVAAEVSPTSRLRVALRIVGISCLVAGLFPYYSWTPRPPSGAGVPPINLPGAGAVADRTSITTVRLGLPFSPLLRYHQEERFMAESPIPSASKSNVSTKAEDMGPPIARKPSESGDVSIVTWRYEIQILSWSTAVAGAGIILLVASFLVSGRRPATTAVETRTGPGV
jgi:hypothetical protein